MSSSLRSRRGRPPVILPAGLAAPADAPAALGPLAPASLPAQAADRLRSLIVRGQLEPGCSIAEAALSAALGISRTPLREALRRLASEGLVTLRPNRGASVTALDAGEVVALFEALAGIERIAAELAAVRAAAPGLRHLAELQNRLERQHAARKMEAYFDTNQSIHRRIVELAANPVLRQVHESLFPRAERGRRFTLQSRPRWDESVHEHREILAALVARNAARAGSLLSDHVRRTGDAVVRLLAERSAA